MACQRRTASCSPSSAPCVLLNPGTSSVAHLEENLAAAGATLDEDARRRLAEG